MTQQNYMVTCLNFLRPKFKNLSEEVSTNHSIIYWAFIYSITHNTQDLFKISPNSQKDNDNEYVGGLIVKYMVRIQGD